VDFRFYPVMSCSNLDIAGEGSENEANRGEVPMTRLMLTATILLIAVPALAQTILPTPTAEEGRAPRPPRARGIPTALAVEADQAAIATCTAQGLKVTALTIDSEGVPIALISGDGAAAITQRIASGKAETALKTKMTSGEAATRAKTDQAFMSQLMADPSMGTPRQGGIPVRVDGTVIGAIAVSGAPSGAQDEPCAKAGLDKIQERLH